ncbi:MAG: sodium-dependent transporter [Desulfovibrio sp.]|uniref:sodium-dependent transporter n=1 Tax=Desulfovibrio sp. 7SRBS1 TaxID=3378064 RepID=UPI003B3EB035
MSTRETWGSRAGFVLAAVGSAIGLGNIWRFPYIAFKNGGGAFLIPYIFALLTAGIPFMILEFGLGHKFRGSAPKTFASISKKWEWLGWLQIGITFVIGIYYVAVIGWAISYTFFSLTQAWGNAPKDFFFNQYLHLSSSPLELGSIQTGILITTLMAWIITWGVLHMGVRNGVEKISKIFMPLLFFMVLLIIGRTLTLDGAMNGLQWLFKPDFSKIMDYHVWTDAYGQIFYTLSIGFSIMITYASYLPKKSDINNNACMTVFINCGFSLLAGIMIFGILGHMAAKQGVGVDEVVSSGVGLAFITIPTAINTLPAPVFFGTLFFLSLTVAGLSSLISIVQPMVSAITDKFGCSHRRGVALICIPSIIFSIVFTTQGGLLLLDIVDHFINNFGILFCGLIEIILLSWICRLDVMREHVNAISEFRVGKAWTFCLRFVTPIVLGYMSICNAIGDLSANYGGYSDKAILYYGWGVLGILVLLALFLHNKKAIDSNYAVVDQSLWR